MIEASSQSSRRQSVAISGMTCGGCAKSVERALSRVPGVERVSVDLSAGRAVVEGRAPSAAIVDAVRAAGYDARPSDAAGE